MKTDTRRKIYQYIKENVGLSVKDIIDNFRLNATGVFRHLLKLQKDKMIYKVGKPPKVHYFAYIKSMSENSSVLQNAFDWAVSGDAKFARPEWFCGTRDVFQGRADRLVNDLRKTVSNENLAYLLTAAVGEIGNNSFDHNLGQWRDAPGAYFNPNLKTREIILADRGQGILATIKRVKPEIQTDADALRAAFTEIISGRLPERRGNGLKFVKKIIEENNLHLFFYTGGARAAVTGAGMEIKNSGIEIPGTLAYIQF